MKSIVRWFNDERGYGFIEYRGKNVFVHISTGDKDKVVEFELTKTNKCYKIKNAVSVK